MSRQDSLQSTEPRNDESLLDCALAEYIEALERGVQMDHDSLAARYLQIAAALRAVLVRYDQHVAQFDRLRDHINQSDPSSADEPISVPKRVADRYQVDRVLDVGGMGIVYHARDSVLDRDVALKMIRPGQLNSEDVARFINEAQAAAQLEHPNIVPIFEVGEFHGRPYFTMPLLTGGNLAHRVAQGPSPGIESVETLIPIARAVQFAHDRGILHRDLKPSNVLIDENGNPRVGDFGLAKRINSSANITQSGAIIGTPSYMAPELLLAMRGGATVVSDVYSLGAILYALLTGRPPHSGESVPAVLSSLAHDDPPPPSRLNRAIDRDLEAIALKCLERDPAKRYGAAWALADDLQRWQSRTHPRAANQSA